MMYDPQNSVLFQLFFIRRHGVLCQSVDTETHFKHPDSLERDLLERDLGGEV